jgi:streptogramin lyase
MAVPSFMAKWLRDSGRRKRTTVRKPPRHRLALEPLDDRILMSVTEFPVPTPQSNLVGITRGPDGNMWFTDALAGKIGRITPAGVITEFSAGLTPGGQPTEFTAGPDGNLWFTEQFPDRIGRITTAGVITEFSAGITPNSDPEGITAGPDGNIWFTEEKGAGTSFVGAIGRITPSGVVTEFRLGSITSPELITTGPDGNLWFGESGSDPQGPGMIGRITTAGVITEFGHLPGEVRGVTAGPDGNIWFTEPGLFTIGKITPAGVITEVARTSPGSFPSHITTGPDGNLWFTEVGADRIGRITTAGALTEFDSTSSPWATWPVGIAVGTDGNIWYTELAGHEIGRLDLAQAAPQTTTTLRTSTATAVVGQTELLTATVTAQAGMPTGTVLFKDGTTQVGFAQVDANGQATLPVSLGVGSHALTAVFVSNAFPGSTSAAVTVTVNPAATTVTLASSLNPVGTGQAVTFTATVAAVAPGAGTPTGTVTFKDGNVVLGTAAVGAGGTATLPTSFGVAGGHAITAVYGGDPNFVGGAQALTEQVNAPDPSQVSGPNSPVALDQAYGLYEDAGGYYTNYRGQGEKYLRGTVSSQRYSNGGGDFWYYLTPNGDLFEFTPSYSNPALVGVKIASLGPAVYNDPSLLWRASAADPVAVDRAYGLYEDGGGYFTNYRGQGEKYLRGTVSSQRYSNGGGDFWYYLTPNGDLFEFTPSYSNPALVGVKIASFGAAVYNDPSLLWNAFHP